MLVNAKMDIDNVFSSTPAIQRRVPYAPKVTFQQTESPTGHSKRPNPCPDHASRPRKISTGSSATNISNIFSFAESSFSESEASVSWVLKLNEDDEAHLDDLRTA